MDPMTAFGLAAGIAQFIQFSYSIVSGTGQILGSAHGLRANQMHSINSAELASDNIQHLMRQIDQDLADPEVLERSRAEGPGEQPRSEERRIFTDLSESCHAVAHEILSTLSAVRYKDRGGRFRSWEALCAAFRTEMKQDYIRELERRLDNMSTQLHMYAQNFQYAKIIEKLRSLEEGSKRLESSRSDDITHLRTELESVVATREQDRSRMHEPWEQLPRAWDTYGELSLEWTILNNLRFNSIDDRYHKVDDAYARTFEWIFSNGNEGPEVNFSEWLLSDRPLYWISGKPGSGKSTLMKYVYRHENTRQLLSSWARGNEFLLVSFFFWAAAKDPLQKSQEGLLRTILYHILRKHPDQIRNSFPQLWASSSSRTGLSLPNQDSIIDIQSLLEAFAKVTSSLDRSRCKLFFIIDGLDEYEGRSNDIITLIGHMQDSTSMKFCLASRSWNEFEVAYGRTNPWKLYIHELTEPDITLFVQENLENDLRFQELRENDDRCPDLVSEVVTAAQGVFLWVRLVIHSLLEGLTNDDRIVDLQQRLRRLPTDLDQLFDRILDSIAPHYREQAAKIFKVALATTWTLPLITYWWIDQGEPSDYKVEPPSEQQLTFRLKQMRGRLNALSKGLLQVSTTNDQMGPTAVDQCYSLHVDLLHRTLLDYMKEPRVAHLLQAWTKSDFNVDTAICNGILAHVTKLPNDPRYFPVRYQFPIVSLLGCFYHHVQRLECIYLLKDEAIRHLRIMRGTLETLEELTGKIKTNILPELLEDDRPASVEFVIARFGLVGYLETIDKLHQCQIAGRSILNFLLLASNERFLRFSGIDVDDRSYLKVLKLLLERGCSPNEILGGGSVWTTYLARVRSLKDGRSEIHVIRGSKEFTVGSIKLMVEYGADLDAKWGGSRRRTTALQMLREILDDADFESICKDKSSTHKSDFSDAKKNKWQFWHSRKKHVT